MYSRFCFNRHLSHPQGVAVPDLQGVTLLCRHRCGEI